MCPGVPSLDGVGSGTSKARAGLALKERERGTVTDQERAEAFLRKRSGLFFCAACLAEEIGVTAFDGRTLLWTLQALRGHEMRGARCVGCRQGKRVIRHVGEVSVAEAKGDVVAFLVDNAGIALCDACVAFATDRSLRDLQRVRDELAPFAEFSRHEGICSVCSRIKPVTFAFTEESRPILTESEWYRNWRLDLISYRIATGWRPLVLIKGPSGSTVPEAPSLLWGMFPSKISANRHALHVARGWVDKHLIGNQSSEGNLVSSSGVRVTEGASLTDGRPSTAHRFTLSRGEYDDGEKIP